LEGLTATRTCLNQLHLQLRQTFQFSFLLALFTQDAAGVVVDATMDISQPFLLVLLGVVKLPLLILDHIVTLAYVIASVLLLEPAVLLIDVLSLLTHLLVFADFHLLDFIGEDD